MDLLDLPAYFDPISRLEGAVSTFLNADWEGAYRKHGVAGLLAEFAACVTSQNAPTLYISRGAGWSGIQVERLLSRHGVKVWDRGLAGDNLYFCVKKRQVKWAEYVMQRAGAPLASAPHDKRSAGWAARHPRGDEPAKHSRWRTR